MNDAERITQASLKELVAGYVETADGYTCICCGEFIEKGIIYPDDGRLYDAERYTRLHIERVHQSVFAHLIQLEKSLTGLTEVQRNLLTLFYQGRSDGEIQAELGVGSTSTIRNHRAALREKERQARLFLAIMELLRARQAPVTPAPHHRKPALSEREQVLRKYFPQGTEGPLTSFAMKEKHRLIILEELVERFDVGQTYTEKEVNALLEAAFPDFVTLRRYLVDYGFLQRLPDGSQYWRKGATNQEETHMDRKELKRLAMETTTEAGVYQIKNHRNGKAFVRSTRNLKTINGQRFRLEMGSHDNKLLQQDWNEFGPEAFAFDVLEVLEKPETGYFDEKDALAKLLKKWLEQLQPYGERGYNTPKDE